MSITYSECVSVALGVERAKRMYYMVIYGYWTQNVCFDFRYKLCYETFLILRTTVRRRD